MKTYASALVFVFLSAIPYVAAHGFVWHITINGQPYTGNIPNANPNPSIVRQINNVAPVKGANNTFLNCGQDAQLASQVANAYPNDVLTFDWRGGDLSHWPHNTGPLMWYMTPCVGPCDQYDSQNAQWFKISQIGRQSNSTWVQQDLMVGNTVNVTLPPVKPGQYLLRHEIIALHLATSPGGAEFYPSCTQLNIGGNGTAVPSSDELVTFPGGYSDTDPGIYDPNVFNTSAPYVFPGPPVAKLAATTSGDSGSSTATPSGAPASSQSSTTPGRCRLRTPTTANHNSVNRRHYSQIMRDLLHPSTWH